MDNERDWFFTLDGELVYLDEYHEYACTSRTEKGVYGRAFHLEDGRVLIRHDDGSEIVREYAHLEAAQEDYTIY